MTERIIDLLPSKDLKAKIKETKHQFTESELLQIIYNYAPTFDEKLSMLAQFSTVASPEIAALANAYIEYEQKNYNKFAEETAGFVYELHIKEDSTSPDVSYLCSSYKAALACIDLFYEEYAFIGSKETEKTKYRIKKRKIFFEENTFEEDAYAECVLGRNKVILKVSDLQDDTTSCELETLCSECKEICPYRCDELRFPCFAHDYAIIKYLDQEEIEQFGVALFWDGNCDGLREELYVIPLDSPPIREHRFSNNFYAHQHIPLPLATLAELDDLGEDMKKNYLAFVAWLKADRSK